MSKYKVGDKVRVRNDLEINKIYGGFKATSKRLSFSNKIVTIKNIFHCLHNVLGEVYGIEEDNDYWTDKMFERKVNDMSELEELKEQVTEIQKKIQELERKDQKEKENKQGFKEGDIYYYISYYGCVEKNIWRNDKYDKGSLSILNCFQTKEEAEFMVEKLKVIGEMKKFTFIPDWNNLEQRKHFMCFNCLEDKIFIDYTINNGYTSCYFETKDDIKECIKVVGKERIKKYYFGIK